MVQGSEDAYSVDRGVPRGRRAGAAICAGLAALLWCGDPAAARAETLTLGYLVGWGHVTLAEAEISFSQTDGRYRLSGTGRTRGLLELLFSWRGRAATEGERRREGRRPLVHEHEGTWNESTRWTRVDWNGAAPPRTEARPPPDPEQVTPVAAATIRGTRDPLTVILSLLDRLAATGRCEGEAKVWDGRRRYDISVSHLGEETLIADRPWAYAGNAVGCALDFERIGGFWRDRPGRRDGDESAALRRVIWAAEIAPGRWALVRAEVETRYGTVVGRLMVEDQDDSES